MFILAVWQIIPVTITCKNFMSSVLAKICFESCEIKVTLEYNKWSEVLVNNSYFKVSMIMVIIIKKNK